MSILRRKYHIYDVPYMPIMDISLYANKIIHAPAAPHVTARLVEGFSPLVNYIINRYFLTNDSVCACVHDTHTLYTIFEAKTAYKPGPSIFIKFTKTGTLIIVNNRTNKSVYVIEENGIKLTVVLPNSAKIMKYEYGNWLVCDLKNSIRCKINI